MKTKTAWALGLALGLIVFVAFVFSLRLFVRAAGLRAYTINSAAMAPTLLPGDRILVNARAYLHSPPQRGDLVTFVRPEVAGEAVFVKRVIAVGGDVIQGDGEEVKLNGRILNEPYIAPLDTSDDPPISFGPVTVPPSQLFLIGDARQNSNDSRYFGSVDLKNIRGQVAYIYVSKDSSRNWTRVK